ncbi:TolC family protein [Anaeromyxobacter oryzae]|uniref:RND transporter n=1 Tax=Anaeromyxobacter oryzae TaxID=2918170 RepID=A0ABM7WYR7_9BACT|nr:TolC family protein [Anaeromyxobacter oryzae]BDG04681.1 RND transporter [Anaeromyxobacter oryzae]
MFAVALVALAASAPAGRPVWTEADAVAAFEKNSPALVDARFAEATARAEAVQAGARPNPNLSTALGNIPLQANLTGSGNGAGFAHNYTTNLELDQPIELGGKRGKRLAAARSAVEEARLGVDDARRSAVYALRTAFWNAVRARERRALAEAVKARYGETLRIMRARFASEDISAVDLDRVELEGSKQENDLADAVAAERAAVAELLRLAGPGAPPDVDVQGTLRTAPAPLDEAALTTRALASRPDLARARAALSTARAGADLARAERIPDVTVGVAWTHSAAVAAGDNPDALAVTLSLPLPIFDRRRGEVQKADVAVSAAERTLAATEAGIGRDVAGAWARYAAAAEKVARYEGGALTRADRALEVMEKTYRAGEKSLLEFLEAERTDIALRADYLDTLYELREARLELEQAVGAQLPEAA